MISLLLGACLASVEPAPLFSCPEFRCENPRQSRSALIDLAKAGRHLRLVGEMKTTDVPRGKAGWQTARFALEWRDAAKRTMKVWPNNRGWTGTSDWRRIEEYYAAPEGAAYLSIVLCNLSSGGLVEFRNVELTAVDEGIPAVPKAETATRARWSLNGVWPVRYDDGTGIERVPAAWSRPVRRVRYARRLVLPSPKGGRLLLDSEQVASRAVVLLDGETAGEIIYPGGTVDLTRFVKPGMKQELVLDVTANPGEATLEYNESTRAERRVQDVKWRGLTGDLWLDRVPANGHVADAWAETSVTRGAITFVAETEGLAEGEYDLRAEVSLGADRRTFTGRATRTADGRLVFTAPWTDAKLWDTHTPGNVYECRLSVAREGRVLDAALPFAVGFREIAIDGRDLRLNGKTLHLRSFCDDTFKNNRPTGEYANALALCRELQSSGFNAILPYNYSAPAGATGYVQEFLRACDETGMLLSFTLPHFKDFGPLDDPKEEAKYTRITKGILRQVRRHPSIILWATSHNAAGYLGAGNPRRIDGIYELPLWINRKNRTNARRARRLIDALDSTRPVYHHESGNLDDFHTVNCYLDWAPIQERSDWLEHWAANGVKPLYFVEWGLPHVASLSSYRGPEFIWRTKAFQSLWASEYAAALRGDAAYEATAAARRALDAEEALWAKGEPFEWHRLSRLAITLTNNYWGIQARFAEDNWRSFRGWGMTAMLPWDFDRSTLSKPIGKALARWNRPECAWIAGDGIFTDKRHHFRPGETVKKTLMILNDRREPAEVVWTAGLGGERRSGRVTVAPGGRARVPVAFAPSANAGTHTITARFDYGEGVVLEDSFDLEIIPRSVVEVSSSVRPRIIDRGRLDPVAFTNDIVPYAKAGGAVVVFEQTKETLEAIGFRVQEYGLRHAFPRGSDPRFAGLLTAERLRDWAGEATLTKKYTALQEKEWSADFASWAGFPKQTRVWRCGNRGAVASVLIEKPSAGDWKAIVDGGFDLQYAPLLVWRVGMGSITFCQLDVTGRTASDPIAEEIVAALRRPLERKTPPLETPRFVCPGERPAKDFFAWIASGGTALLAGLSAEETRIWSPVPLSVVETNSCHFSRIERLPGELDGLSNADWAWHGVQSFAAFTEEDPEGNVAFRIVRHGKGRLVFWQVPPGKIDHVTKPYLRTTKRRAQAMEARLKANLGFPDRTDSIVYADEPMATDDPYRYFHW